MENPAIHLFTKSQLEAINACRIFLQVNTIAEISSCKGTVLLQCAVKATTDATQTWILWRYSRLLLKWPHQPKPPQTSRYLWKQFLKHFTTNTAALQLMQPLGLWYNNAHKQRKWTFLKYFDDIIQTSTSPMNYFISPINQQQYQYKSYNKQPVQTIILNNCHVSVFPTHIGQESITCGDPVKKCNTLETSNIFQHIPITINNIHPFLLTDKNIATDGRLHLVQLLQ
jgi:hypothetical protein